MTETKIHLVKDTVDSEDIKALIKWLETEPRLTKGPETIEFEKEWSKWLGTKYSVFCNSGSSANLLMLYALIAAEKIRNKKVVVPALAWATDLSPVMQLGMEPILCDCNGHDLSVDINHLEQIFINENPSSMILVSVLGLPPNMSKIVELCKKYDVILLEDVCESLGAKWEGDKLGTFGLMSSFSLYFGHHLSTIEGGMVCTDDEEIYEVLKSIRSHGWDRDASPEYQKKWRDKWGVDEFNGLYTFYHPGFNLRSTDLQAFIGRRQVKKADKVVESRHKNWNLFQELIVNPEWKPEPEEGGYASLFCYPVVSTKRDVIVKDLQDNGIEVRPLICGSMGIQPMYIKEYGRKELPNSSYLDKNGFYVPNHDKLTEDEIKLICNTINKHTTVTDEQ